MSLGWRAGILIMALVMISVLISFAAEPGDPERGKAWFLFGCMACHGEMGKGDGPASKSFNPLPRDLTDAQYMQGLTDDYLFNVIKAGGGAFQKPNMPGWSHLLKDEEIWNLIAYIRTLSNK